MLRKITLILIVNSLIFNNCLAYATDTADDSAGWELIDIARQGLFWICMFISFYGLYLWVLKKDGEGKKWVFTPMLVYVGSYLVPKFYILIRHIFSK